MLGRTKSRTDKMKQSNIKFIFGGVSILALLAAFFTIGFFVGWKYNASCSSSRVSTNINITTKPVVCNISTVNLSNFEVWKREEGYWYGEYTFLGKDGDPYVSSGWNYNYAHYYGFIHLQLNGNSLKQRNVFIYPPQSNQTCSNSNNLTKGRGDCGINGNEKIFAADQQASDCNGNLAGPYPYGAYTLDTYTQTLKDDTVIYTVKLPANFGGGFNQNQLTSLPGNGIRVRTAQGFDFAGKPSYASFYREYKEASRESWIKKLKDIRAKTNILPLDECGFTSSNTPSGTNCTNHFGFTV